MQDTRTPVQIAGISIIANILLGVILMKPLAHGGLALATSLASILNLGLLVISLRAKLGALGFRSIMLSTCRTVLCSATMGMVVWLTAQIIVPMENKTLSGLLFGVTGSIAAGLCIYGAMSYAVKSPELNTVLAEVRKGIRKND